MRALSASRSSRARSMRASAASACGARAPRARRRRSGRRRRDRARARTRGARRRPARRARPRASARPRKKRDAARRAGPPRGSARRRCSRAARPGRRRRRRRSARRIVRSTPTRRVRVDVALHVVGDRGGERAAPRDLAGIHRDGGHRTLILAHARSICTPLVPPVWIRFRTSGLGYTRTLEALADDASEGCWLERLR